MSARVWWPARRASPPDVGYEPGFMPGSFEPEETLGDTDAMPLDPVAAHARELDLAAWWPEVLGALTLLGALIAAWKGLL